MEYAILCVVVDAWVGLVPGEINHIIEGLLCREVLF